MEGWKTIKKVDVNISIMSIRCGKYLLPLGGDSENGINSTVVQLFVLIVIFSAVAAAATIPGSAADPIQQNNGTLQSTTDESAVYADKRSPAPDSPSGELYQSRQAQIGTTNNGDVSTTSSGSVFINVDDEDGYNVENAEVVFYSSGYDSVLDTKYTDSYGNVEFNGYSNGDYIYEIYVDGEFWGGGTVSIDDSDTTFHYFDRTEPYETTTEFTDKTDGDGTYFVDDTINIAPRVRNDGSATVPVQVLIKVDTDNDGDSDITKTRGPSDIESDSYDWFGYDYVPSSSGTKQVRVITQRKFGSGSDARWVETDDTGWSESIYVNSNDGDLEISVNDENGYDADDTTVVLYDDDWNRIGERDVSYDGTVNWYGLDPGTYRYEVYLDGEFWGGGSVDISRGETTSEPFYRIEPYEDGSNVVDAGDGDGTFISGEEVELQVDVRNDVSYDRDVEVTFHVDTDDDGTVERTFTTSGRISGNSEKTFTETYTPNSGEDSFYVTVDTKFSNGWSRTDNTGWLESYTVDPDEGSLVVTSLDRNGNTASNADVVLYDSSWNELSTKTTGSSGEVSWANLETTTHYIEIYGPKGSFWGGAEASVSAGETSTVSVQRTEPYETQTTLIDKEGNGKHVVGEQVTISPNVYNDVSVDRPARVQIYVDTDNDGTAEVTKTRGPLTIGSDDSEWFGYDHTIESAGTKQVRVVVESEFTVDGETKWVQTDDTGWTRQFDAIQDEGGVTVSVTDQGGNAAQNVDVVAYDENWNEIGEKSTNSAGEVTFSGLDTTTHHFEVYGSQGSFWGGGSADVTAGTTNQISLSRKEPYEQDTTLSDKEGNGKHIIGDVVTISPNIYNDVSVDRDVKVEIHVDTDGDGTAEVTKTRGEKRISSDDNGWFGYEHRIDSAGTKQVRVVTLSKFTVDGETKWVQTDDTGWKYSFETYEDKGAATVGVTDEDGTTPSQATVVIYNSSWEEVASKTTDGSASVTFSDLETEVHNVEVYGPEGSLWGGGTVEINATETATTTFTRTNPYTDETTLTDENNNGKHVIGESITISPRVANDGIGPRGVRVRILLDTDNDGTAETEKLRGPLLVDEGDSRWYGYEHTIETAGTTQVRVITETNFTIDGAEEWVQTGDTGWNRQYDAIKDEGSISVAGRNASGDLLEEGTVVLYDSDWEEVSEKSLDSTGVASWSGLPTGTYNLELYGPDGSFWGGSQAEILAGETTDTTLRRIEPHYEQTTLEDVTNGDGVFQVREKVLISPTVRNPSTVTKVVRTRILVDTDNDGSAEVSKLRGPINITAGDVGGFGYEHTLSTTGTKRVRVITETKFTVEGETKWVQTGDSGWAKSFQSRRSGAGINVTVEDRNGKTVTGATVVLYDQEWNELASQESDLDGQVEWTALDAGTYHLEVYGPDGAFWGGKTVEAEPGFINSTTVQRKEPYAKGSSFSDIEDGDGIHQPEDKIALNTTVTTTSAGKPVRVKFHIDTDGDGTADQTVTSSQTVVERNTQTTLGAVFTPSSTGEKRVRTEVETAFTVDGETKWVTTDTTGWTLNPDVVAEGTDLKVTVQEADATKASDVSVVVYDSNYNLVTDKSVSNGVAYFDQLSDGEYTVEVYGESGYWNKQTVTVGATAESVTIRRLEPRIQSSSLSDGNTDGGYETNESVKASATVANGQTQSRTVRLVTHLDTDGDGAADTVLNTSATTTIDAGASADLSTSFEFERTGTYWLETTVQTWIDGKWVDTGETDWQSIGINDDGTNSTVSVSITQKPTDPAANERILFRSDTTTDVNTAIKSRTWHFGDGETATGREVAHTYDETGSYTVSLVVITEDGEQYRTFRQIEVSSATDEYTLESVDPIVRGSPSTDLAIVEGTEINVTYEAEVSQPEDTASVTFKLGDQKYTDTDGSDGWTFPLNTSSLDESQTLVVTATSTSGETDRQARQISIVQSPEWFQRFELQNVLSEEGVLVYQTEFPEGGASANGTIPNRFPFGDDVSMPGVGSSQSSEMEVYIIVKVDLATTETDVTVGGTIEYEMQVVTVTGDVSGTSYLDLEEGDFQRGRLNAVATATAEYPPAPTGIPSPPVGPVPPGAVSVYPIFTAEVETTAQFDEQDGPNSEGIELKYTGGTVSPRLEARQEVGKKWAAVQLVIGFEEGIDTEMPMPSMSTMNGTVYGQMYARASAYSFEKSVSYPGGADRFEYTFDNVSVTATAGSQDSDFRTDDGMTTTDWSVSDKTGARPPKPNAETGGFGGHLDPMSPGYQPTRIIDTGTITDNRVADESPSLARTGNGHTVVWSRQIDSKSTLNGRDIYVSRSESNVDFDTPAPVTDDGVADYDPALAGGSGEALVAFTTFDHRFNTTDTTEPSEMYPYGEIRFSTFDGSNWSRPQSITSDSAFDFGATVAYQDGTYLIAWVEDSDNDLGTWEDRSVKYVRYDGTFGEVQTIETARLPKATTDSNGNFRLAYFEMDENMTNGAVNFRTLDSSTGTMVAETSQPVGHLSDIAVSNESIAWVDATTPETPLYVHSDGTTEKVPIKDEIAVPQAVHLTQRNSRLLVSFRAHTPGSDVARVFYTTRAKDQWLPARKYADGTAANLTFWQGDSAATDSGFLSVFAGKELSSDQKHDLYVFRQQFRADLTVDTNVSTETETVGSPATVEFNVSNTGDLPANDVEVALVNESGVVETTTISSLSPGSTTTGTFTTTVDSSGKVSVVADPNGEIEEFNESNNKATSVVIRPDATVSDLKANRSADSVVVTTTVSNPTTVRLPNVSYLVRTDSGYTVDGRVGPLEPGNSTTVSVTIPAAELTTGHSVEFIVDDNDALTESNEENNSLSRPIFSPELGVSAEQINYYKDDGQTVATVLVDNNGLQGTNATVRVTNATTGKLLGKANVTVNGSPATWTTAYTRAHIPLPNVTEASEVHVEINTQNESHPGDNVAIDDVEFGTTLLPPTAEVETNRTRVQMGTSVSLSVAQSSDPDGEIDTLYWVYPNGTRVMNQSELVWQPTEAGNVTVTLVVVDDDGLTERTPVTLQVYDGPPPVQDRFKPPSDPDSDGKFEDINGDETSDIVDVQAFYTSYKDPRIQGNGEAFDFNGDGEVNIIDVQALYSALQSEEEGDDDVDRQDESN